MRGLAFAVFAACGRIGFVEQTDGMADTNSITTTHLVAYGDQTCAAFDGAAYCWGANTNGQLGNGSTANAPSPMPVAIPAPITDITLGDTHGCAVAGGTLFCWGSIGSPTPAPVTVSGTPVAVAAGNGFTCVIADVLRCWGINTVGQCGTGTMTPQPTPAPVMLGTPFTPTAIEAGDDHACAFAPGNTPECWGHNDDGALGTGSVTPTQSLTGVAVSGGIATLPHIAGWHTCAITPTGVACWGEGTTGELGDGLMTNSASPVSVVNLANVTALESGGGPTDHDATCAVTGGAVKCWGRGNNGRLGQGQTTSASTPVDVLRLPGPAVDVALGYGHTCALLSDGDIYCWGRGDRGQLGDGMMTSSLSPVRVLRP